jgi:hypothetical protein
MASSFYGAWLLMSALIQRFGVVVAFQRFHDITARFILAQGNEENGTLPGFFF